MTVTGPVAPERLGRTLMHEHVICDFYRITGNLNQLLNDEALAVEELGHLKAAGGTAISRHLGRDRLAEFGHATGGGVADLPGVQGLLGGVLDGGRGVEIGLADLEVDHLVPRRLQRVGQVHHMTDP